MMTTNKKIDKLRSEMNKEGIDAVIIPSSDPHESEYVASRWLAREWISGFNGSAGTVVVTKNKAGLWTDSRYYLQGQIQLEGTYISLHKLSDPSYPEWLCEELDSGNTVSIDGNVCSYKAFEKLQQQLNTNNITLVHNVDLVSNIWIDRPDLPSSSVFVHEVKYAGESRREKLQRLRMEMAIDKCTYHLVSTLDDIAWIFNLRGGDVEYCPVNVGFAIITDKDATLYMVKDKFTKELLHELQSDNIDVKSYQEIIGDLNKLDENTTMSVDPANCNVVNYNAINSAIKKVPSYAREMKAIKNASEITHLRNVMVKDGIAIAQSFYWLEQLHENGKTCSEIEFSNKLAEYRSQQQHYVGESFGAIIGYKGNGAIIHYRPTIEGSHQIEAEGVLLADSGGQYFDGTTDITRTVALSSVSKEIKHRFTLVLKGMIQLSNAVFPENTTGSQLDTLARMHLWNAGLNFGHGTGHGVGFFLNVHEPPQGFAPNRSERANTVHKIGMLSSNEPGYYKEGEYGIRIENLIVVTKSDHEGFLEFETLTLYPIDLEMIDDTLLTSSEKAWLNQYHNKVWKQIGIHLKGDIKTWFELKCRGFN